MANPYRPEGAPADDELRRLAREGERRIQSANASREGTERVESNKNLRVAIGALRGSALRRALLAFLVVGVALMAAGILAVAGVIDRDLAGLSGLGFVVALTWFILFLFVPPLATRAQVEAERAWIASLPFAFGDYLRVLSEDPRALTKLRVEIVWRGASADERTLQGIIGLIDTDARVLRCDATGATIQTGQISGFTGIKVNGARVYRNHQLARFLGRFVDKVLMPLERNVGLSSVTLQRDW